MVDNNGMIAHCEVKGLMTLGKLYTGQYGEGVSKQVQELVGGVERLAKWLSGWLRHGNVSNEGRM